MAPARERDCESSGQRGYPRDEGGEDGDEEDGKGIGADAEEGLCAVWFEVVGEALHVEVVFSLDA